MVGAVRRILVTGALALAVASCGGSDEITPISQQSCRELVATLRDIRDQLSPEESFETWERARRQQTALTARVAVLGGCPDQPALQPGAS
jgi:hypothetical protein